MKRTAIINNKLYIIDGDKVTPADTRTTFQKDVDLARTAITNFGKSLISPESLKYMVPGLSTVAFAKDAGKDLDDAISAAKKLNYLDMLGRGVHAAGNVALGAVSLVPFLDPLIAGATKAEKAAAVADKELVQKPKLARQLKKQIEATTLETPKEVPGNIGWAPAQDIDVVHASNSSAPLELYYPNRWDVVNESANPFGIWYQGKLGTPRTVTTNGAVKGAKAEKARELFAGRPYQKQGTLSLSKPMQTIGEVPDRSALSYQAERLGADGVIFNDVYDNGYNGNQVILSQKEAGPSIINTVQSPSSKQTYLGLLERPNTLTEEELAGLSKAERNTPRSSNGKIKLKRAVDPEIRATLESDILDAPYLEFPNEHRNFPEHDLDWYSTPHPDLATPFGFKSRDLASPKINFKFGGKLKKK